MSARPGTGQRPGPAYHARQQVERAESQVSQREARGGRLRGWLQSIDQRRATGF